MQTFIDKHHKKLFLILALMLAIALTAAISQTYFPRTVPSHDIIVLDELHPAHTNDSHMMIRQDSLLKQLPRSAPSNFADSHVAPDPPAGTTW